MRKDFCRRLDGEMQCRRVDHVRWSAIQVLALSFEIEADWRPTVHLLNKFVASNLESILRRPLASRGGDAPPVATRATSVLWREDQFIAEQHSLALRTRPAYECP